jgi:1,4-dihydroxy-6-naphthoate synthase
MNHFTKKHALTINLTAMRICFSSCPNDTFIFHAMLHGLVDCEGLHLDAVIADISQLNSMAMAGAADAIKISYAAYPLVKGRYRLLDAGSALGYGNGPLLVGRHADVCIDAGSVIATPGAHTTAALLLRKAFPAACNFVEVLFSDIISHVQSGRAHAGVLIHESRFTYRQHGLSLLCDLGAWWHERYGLPLPLGGIVMSRGLEAHCQQAFARIMRRSVEYAMRNPEASAAFVRHHARELSHAVIQQHIAMFVNDYTLSLGKSGRAALRILFGN